MSNLINARALENSFALFQQVGGVILGICTAAVLVAVVIDFFVFHRRHHVASEKKSIVETGTMLLFVLFFSGLIRYHIGEVTLNHMVVRYILSLIGIIAVMTGSIVNIHGRFHLGPNWANQVKIYDDHSLIQSGPYRLVRHPLYASLIWMFFGVCLMRLNIGGFLATTLIFFPMMTYRAKQEEGLLRMRFPEYAEYSGKTGMFFPKIRWKRGE